MTIREVRIAEIAYYKWLDDGQPEGRDMEFWLWAEIEYERRSLDGGFPCD